MKKRTVGLLLIGVALLSSLGTLFISGSFFFQKKPSEELVNGLGEVYWYLDAQYYQDVDTNVLNKGALKGAVDALGDPYSEYLTKEEYEQVQIADSGKYSGIGVTIEADPETGHPVAAIVHKGAPAEIAGMETGDVMTAVDGVPIDTSRSITQLASELKGAAGSQVIVSVYRDGASLDIPIIRGNVIIHRAEGRMLDENLGYIAITEFNGDCMEEFQKVLHMIQSNNTKGLILDLRNNPGGYLDFSTKIADEFLSEGVIVTMKDKAGEETVYRSDKNIYDIPIVVLMNANSASASEVLAGALQDRQAALVVGENSFGKALVQRYYPMSESEGWLKITIASYYTPNGKNISGTGIEPDYVVKLAEEQIARPSTLTDENDTQLQKAIGLLQQAVGAQ